MKYAIVIDGVVANIAVSEKALGANWVESTVAKKGDLYNGSVFTTPEPVATTPGTITQVQGMKALHRAGKKKAIKTMLSAPGNEEAEIAFEYNRTWNRDSQFIADLAPALGMTEEEIDALFIVAAEI